MGKIAVLIEKTPQDSAQAHREPPRLSELVLRPVGFFQLAHFQERHQKRQRRLRTLIFIGPVRMEAVSTAAGGGIVERNLKIVISQEADECGPRLFPPTALACCS